MVKHGFVFALTVPLLFSSLAFAEEANDAKDKSQWRQEVCTENYAESQAGLAYLEAKLNLTEQQKPAWEQWRQTKLDAAQKRRAACAEREQAKDAPRTALDREARLEKALSDRLQDLQASRPALQALYESLNADQKVVFDRGSEGNERRQKGEGRRFGGQ